jgi:lipopolysaccharide/colanic/teichoic acid biosynthesis glycosyltransferase
METYLKQVHNLTKNIRFSKLAPGTKSAIVSYYTDWLGSLNSLEDAIKKESSVEVLKYLKQHLDIKKYNQSIIFTTDLKSYIEDVDFDHLRAIIDFKKVNNIQHVNGLFRAVNTMLPDGGIYVGRLETYWERKLRIYQRFGHQIGRLFWICDFILNRIIPRIPLLDSFYYRITNGEFHSISKAEVLGRLAYCGFEIIDFVVINGLSYYVAIKTKEPYKFPNPSYYPIIKLQRVGQHGKMIGVYKFRTMHPYSEYLQDYVIQLHGYNNKGKPAEDFRLTRWGRWMRRYGFDELPQLINVAKGEMKLVGLRPLSLVRYNEFPEDLQIERIKYKPGCFPPYVALNMPSDKLNIEAERIYIKDLSLDPQYTDLRYFTKSIYNIIFSSFRSS